MPPMFFFEVIMFLKMYIAIILFCCTLGFTIDIFALGRQGADFSRQQRGYRARCDEYFRTQKDKPFVPGRIQYDWRDRGDFTRHYGQSVVNFAFKAFYFNQQLKEANDAIIELCKFHLEREQTLFEIHSFPSFSRDLAALCKYYGPKGIKFEGRMSNEAYEIALKTMWIWLVEKSDLSEAEYENSKTLDVIDSENHHTNHFSTCWMFASVLCDNEQYRDKEVAEGVTCYEHYKKWGQYASEYFLQRAKKGMQVEIASPSYATATLGAAYYFYDFAEDELLKHRADCFITLLWALWAQEQLDGVSGGGKTRCYPRSGFGGEDFMRRASYFYFGFGDSPFIHANMLNFVTSSWRMPPIVYNLAVNPEKRGKIEITQRRMGLAVGEYNSPSLYRLNGEYGGILRYSYATPDFVIGSLMTEARSNDDWTAISSQNRWFGVIFASDINARIYPQCLTTADSNYNQYWAVQSKGALITQKLKDSKYAADMRVWFSQKGLSKPVEKNGWIFTQAGDAFAAVRPVSGGFEWQAEPAKNASGKWLRCTDEFSPVIIEVADKDMFKNLDAFIAAVDNSVMVFKDDVLKYKSVYGDELTLYADYSQSPKINGKTIDYAPRKVYDSPFISSIYDSGVVRLSVFDEEIILDFADNR